MHKSLKTLVPITLQMDIINGVRNGIATNATAAAIVSCATMAMADDYGVFNGIQSSLYGVMQGAISMLQSFIIPMATIACIVAILMMYMPGMSTKTTDRCKSVIWGCIGTVVVAFGLNAIFTLGKSIGEQFRPS